MKFIFLNIFMLALAAQPGFAKKTKNNEGDKNSIHKILVVIGDEKTFFEFNPSQKNVSIKDRAGKFNQFTLNEAGLSFFETQFAQDFGANDDLTRCLHKYIRYSIGAKIVKGCIGHPSKAAKGLTDLTNALSGLFADEKK
jgi:hypothetical protein